MQAHAQRLQQRNLGIRHGVGHLVQPAGWVNVVPGQGAMGGWHAVKVDGGAEIVLQQGRMSPVSWPPPPRPPHLASEAHAACSLAARHAGLNGHPVARLYVCHALPDSEDDPARLVAECRLVGNLPGPKAGCGDGMCQRLC